MSVRDTAIEAVKTLLNTGAPGGTPAFSRGYLFAVDAAQLPVGSIYPMDDDAELVFSANMPVVEKHMLKLGIAVYEKSAVGVPVDKVVEPHIAWIEKALSGKRATDNVGPYHLIFTDNIEWNYDQLDHGYVRAVVHIGVSYQHKVGDPDTWA